MERHPDPPTAGLNLDGGIHEVPLVEVPGRLHLCGKHVIGNDPERVLSSLPADALVCLVERHEMIERYPTYVAWLAAAPRNRAIHHPMHDLAAPELSALRPLLDDLVDRLRRGQVIVVHCGAGIGRAGTVAVAIMVLLGTPLDLALRHVRRYRPMAGPEVGSQMALVQQLDDERRQALEDASPEEVAGDVDPQAGGESQ